MRIFQVLRFIPKSADDLPHYWKWVPILQDKMADCLDEHRILTRAGYLVQIQEAYQ